MVYLFLVDKFELVEALTVVDLLRRAKIELTTVSITDSLQVTSSASVTVTADALYADCDFANATTLILPGGPGVFEVPKFKPVCDLLVSHYNAGKLICAICAAPKILYDLGIKVKSTVFPSLKDQLPTYVAGKVVTDTNYISGEALGAALEFSLEIIKSICGAEKADEIKAEIVK